jgi:hypothetical protein
VRNSVSRRDEGDAVLAVVRGSPAVKLYGLADVRLPDDGPRQQVVIFYATRVEAEKALRGVVYDEPTWAPFLRIAEFPLVDLPVAEPSLN